MFDSLIKKCTENRHDVFLLELLIYIIVVQSVTLYCVLQGHSTFSVNHYVFVLLSLSCGADSDLFYTFYVFITFESP